MGQLLFMFIVPPLVGVVTYAIVRIIFEKDEGKDGETLNHHQLDVR